MNSGSSACRGGPVRGTGNCLAGRRHRACGRSNLACALMVCRDRNSSPAISGKVRWVDSIRQQAQLRSGQGRGAEGDPSPGAWKAPPAGSWPRCTKTPRRGRRMRISSISRSRVRAAAMSDRARWHLASSILACTARCGRSVGQSWPQALGADELHARAAGDVCPGARRRAPAPRRTATGRCPRSRPRAPLSEPGRPGPRPRLQSLCGHRQQRPLARTRPREHLVRRRPALGADRVLERARRPPSGSPERTRAIPLLAPGVRVRDISRRERPHGLVGVRAHIFLIPFRPRWPSAGRPRPRRPGHRAAPVLVLPAIDHVCPPLGVSWPRRQRGQHRGQYCGHRVALNPAALVQPAEPPLEVVTRPCR